MRRLLPIALVLAAASSWSTLLPAAAQTTEPPASLQLVSQSAINDSGHPLELVVRATNLSGASLDQLSVELFVQAPATSRSLYELTLAQEATATLYAFLFPVPGSLAPGQARNIRLVQSVAALTSRGDSGLYPLKLELRSRDVAVAALRTPMVFLIEHPRVPLNLAWTWVLSEPLQYRPDGTFVPGPLEADVAPGGRLQTMAAALQSVSGRRVDVVVSSVLVDQLQRMAEGYRILDPTGVRSVSKGTAGAADAADLLRVLRAVAGNPHTELLATPFPDPSLPALVPGGFVAELPALAERGRSLVQAALGAAPSDDVVRPYRSEVDPTILSQLASMGAREVLVDPGFFSAPRFQSPSVVRMTGAGSSASAVVPNPEVAALAEAYRDDPVLAAHVALGELAATWLELPGTPGRGAAVLFGEDPDLPSPFFRSFASLVRSSLWLRTLTASDFVSEVRGGERRPLPARAYPRFSPSYVTDLLQARQLLARFRLTVQGSATEVDQLHQDLLLAQSGTVLSDPLLGRSFIQAIGAQVRRTYDRIRIATSVVTLTSQGGLLPLILTNDSGQSLRVRLRFVTDRRLQFTRGASQRVALAPGRRTFTIRVRAQTTGRIPVKVQVLSWGDTPDTIAERTMVIRSTAYNRVALVLTIGAAVFLLGWWGRRFLPRRRS